MTTKHSYSLIVAIVRLLVCVKMVALQPGLKSAICSLMQAKTASGLSAFGLAAAEGDVTLCQLLCDFGADLTQVDAVGASPLILAAYHGHTHVINFILGSRQGGNVGRQYLLKQHTARGETALMATAKMGHLDTLKVSSIIVG